MKPDVGDLVRLIGKGEFARTYLVGSKVDVARMQDHIIIGVCDTLSKYLSGREACKSSVVSDLNSIR